MTDSAVLWCNLQALALCEVSLSVWWSTTACCIEVNTVHARCELFPACCVLQALALCMASLWVLRQQ
jgi:hypothetical protein